MFCPIDGTELQRAERQGVEIDWCPRCRGVWLDRNELDKIIERTMGWGPPPASQGTPYYQGEYQQQPSYGNRGYQYDDDDRSHHKRKRKRSGFLDDLFDFD